jgi:hypothetical protein
VNIRTITIGLPVSKIVQLSELKTKIQKFLDDMRTECARREIFIRTCRINLSPIPENPNKHINMQTIIGKIEQVSRLCDALDIRWFNVPFDLTKVAEKDLEAIVVLAFEIIKRFPKTFVNLIVASENKIRYRAIDKASKFIKDVSRLDNSGYNNFRVGVSCNIRPDTPFFPISFSSENIGFSIGLELPQEFTKIINGASTNNLTLIRKEIINKLLPEIREIDNISKKEERRNSIAFNGIDLSLAPYPEKDSSVAGIMELLGLEKQGSNGTLFLTSYLTNILKILKRRGKIKSTGFNGVMFSLLEDEVLGRRNNSDVYSIDSLISYSAVCGCGLDMVPLPGDIFEEELSSIILDVAALSTVLRKPLGVRVLPIPMKQENEFTIFNMDFIFNTRIKKIKKSCFLNNNHNNDEFSFLNG